MSAKSEKNKAEQELERVLDGRDLLTALHETYPNAGFNVNYCSCGVPKHLHNTCCGWTNASCIIHPRNEQESEWKRRWEEANLNVGFTFIVNQPIPVQEHKPESDKPEGEDYNEIYKTWYSTAFGEKDFPTWFNEHYTVIKKSDQLQ